MKYSTNIEKLFYIDYFNMYLYRYYIEEYRKKALSVKQRIDRIIACAPIFFLTLVMICDSKRHIWITFASIFSVIEVFCRYLPYQTKITELQNCAREVDILLGRVRRCWDKYKLGLIQASEFQKEYEQCYESYTMIYSSMTSEAYTDNPKYRDCALKKANERLLEITDYQIATLLNELRDERVDLDEQ